jgi:hypothetical protein
VIECGLPDAESVDVEQLATGAAAVPGGVVDRLPVVQMVVAPSLISTVPVGVLLPLARVTVAVKVTRSP